MRFPTVTVLVPVYNPEPGLESLVTALEADFGQVVVVDDGSCEQTTVFDGLKERATVLRHAHNRGKGAAIKTALDAVPPGRSVVTVDGDGQHRLPDVASVVTRCLETDRVTFGVRDFLKAGIPFRSRWGNLWTSAEVRLRFGYWIPDTQTGLRAIPARLIPVLRTIPGERFEYEAGYFRRLHALGERIEQVPIETVYLASNRASHFRPFRDTLLTQRALFFGCRVNK